VERLVVLRRRLPRGKSVLFEEALADKIFQISPEASAMGNRLSLTIMVETIIFHSGKYRVMLDQLRASYPWLVLDGTKDLIDGEP